MLSQSLLDIGRECICPEVNRNANIGEVGANMQRSMFKRHFAAMAWYNGTNSSTASGFGDLSYLGEAAYTAGMTALLQQAQLYEGAVSLGAINQLPKGQVYLLLYKVGLQHLHSVSGRSLTW